VFRHIPDLNEPGWQRGKAASTKRASVLNRNQIANARILAIHGYFDPLLARFNAIPSRRRETGRAVRPRFKQTFLQASPAREFPRVVNGVSRKALLIAACAGHKGMRVTCEQYFSTSQRFQERHHGGLFDRFSANDGVHPTRTPACESASI
jgi:hypothetical protein